MSDNNIRTVHPEYLPWGKLRKESEGLCRELNRPEPQQGPDCPGLSMSDESTDNPDHRDQREIVSRKRRASTGSIKSEGSPGYINAKRRNSGTNRSQSLLPPPAFQERVQYSVRPEQQQRPDGPGLSELRLRKRLQEKMMSMQSYHTRGGMSLGEPVLTFPYRVSSESGDNQPVQRSWSPYRRSWSKCSSTKLKTRHRPSWSDSSSSSQKEQQDVAADDIDSRFLKMFEEKMERFRKENEELRLKNKRLRSQSAPLRPDF